MPARRAVPHSAVEASGRVAGLDVLRALAVLAVMARHYLTSGLVAAGWVGVDLFFVISGYLITSILLDTKGTPQWRSRFYVRRILRIWPLYYSVLAVLIWTASNHRNLAGREWAYWLHLSNWSMGLQPEHDPPDQFVPLWSLAVEEQFYLLWPWVVARLKQATLVRLCVALVGLSFLFRVGLVLAGTSPTTVYMLTPDRLDGLALGALLALVVRGPSGSERAYRLGWVALLLTTPALVAIVYYQRGLPWDTGLSLSLGILLVSVVFMALLAVTHGGRSIPTGGPARVLSAIGVRSYGLYLMHQPVAVGLAALALHLPLHAFSVVAAVCSYIVAAVSWRYFESPILRLKALVPYGNECGDTILAVTQGRAGPGE
ncbi:MAG: acyltransferase [Chloroflexi bacterium]|nr:acyltransferase [Chloroflexota bacterium]